MKAIDSNLLVYASLANHPTIAACENLPAKGLPRILLRVHRRIEQHDAALARVFHSATQALSSLV